MSTPQFESYQDFCYWCYMRGVKPTLEGWHTSNTNVSSRPVIIEDVQEQVFLTEEDH